MYSELYQYLIEHKKLAVPGIGTFLLQREAATIDFPNKLINPPVYTIALHSTTASPSRNFFDWLSSILHVSDTDAIVRFNDFSLDLKNKLNDQQTIDWNGIGKIYKKGSGDIVLDPVRIRTGNPLSANRVLREKAEHTVRVGEDQRSSVEMKEILRQDDIKRNYWWAWALGVALLALMFIGWYFSENGLEPSSSANQQKLEPTSSPETYKLVE